jgi:hypothetical protein
MMRRTVFSIVALALGLSALPALAAFENVDISPRARAMGDAAVAIADDAFAPYFNPAGMAAAARPMLGNSYVEPYGLSFNEQLYFGGVLPVSSKLGSFGFGFRRFAVEYEGVALTTESTFTLAHGISLYEDMHSTVSVGTALNMYRLEYGLSVGGIDPGDASSFGLDVGLLVTLHERTRIGVLVKNMNNPQIGEDNEALPQRLHGGIAYEPYIGVTTTFEFENTIEGETQYHGGLEFAVLDALFLRAGMATNPNKFMGGFGYAYEGVSLNYGFSSGGGVLSPSHQFGLTFAWGGEAQ